MVNILNKVSFKNTIILSKRSNCDLFNLMLGELNLLKEKYKEKYDYLILEENIFNKFFNLNNKTYPNIVIIKNTNTIINITGFRKLDYMEDILDKIN